MKSSLELYSYINAKLKTRLDLFIKKENLNNAIQAKTLIESFLPLRGTPFEILEKIYSSTGDLKMAEAELFAMELNAYLEVISLVEEPLTSFVRALARGPEIEHVKNTIRLWFDAHVRGRSIDDRTVYCYRGPTIDSFNINKILSANNTDEVIQEFLNTSYFAVIKECLPNVVKLGTLFELETALDKRYYALLEQACKNLPRSDISIAQRFIALDVDIENIASLVRLNTFLGIRNTDIEKYLIQYEDAVSVKSLKTLYASENIPAAALVLLGKKYAGLASLWSRGDLSSKLATLERVLREMRNMEARKLLAGNPFSIGIIIAYFILLGDEIVSVRTILNAKYYGLSEERIRSIV